MSASLAAQESYPPPFPRPNAVKLVETDRLVVWDIVWPKHLPTRRHLWMIASCSIAGSRGRVP